MSEQRAHKPFQVLGSHLKAWREQASETLGEVSGAIEIEPEALQQIEQGDRRPSEDILVLLINHFNISEDEADKIWEMAGFPQDKTGNPMLDNQDPTRPFMVVMPIGTQIVYTDMVQVSVNGFGVVMNFLQTNGVANQPMAVARVGMSREHAESIVELLQESLHPKPKIPKALPAGSQTAKIHKKSPKN
jgi:transcriptional regulator with XRE-family HTH domain